MPHREAVSGKARLEGDRLTITTYHQRVRKGGEIVEYEKVKTYRYERLDPHPEIGCPAIRLTQDDGTTYDVILRPWGAECECADFHYCRDHKDEKGCKHVAALRGVNLLPPLRMYATRTELESGGVPRADW